MLNAASKFPLQNVFMLDKTVVYFCCCKTTCYVTKDSRILDQCFLTE